MVDPPFIIFKEKITQLQSHNDILQVTKNKDINPEALKLALNVSIGLINDIFIEYNKDQKQISELETKLQDAEIRYKVDIFDSRQLWGKLRLIFEEVTAICEIASQESKGLRTNPK